MVIIDFELLSLLNSTILQAPIPVIDESVKDFTTGSKIISGLLGFISVLMWYIWNTTRAENKERYAEQKEMAENRHRDTMRLFDRVNDRIDALDSYQQEQAYQLFTMNGIINISQGKDFNYNNPPPKKREVK